MRTARRPAASTGDLMRQYLETEIKLASTFVTTANIEYRYGDMAGGHLAKHKAVQACAEIERRLDDAGAWSGCTRVARAIGPTASGVGKTR